MAEQTPSLSRPHTEWFRFTSKALPEDTFHVVRFTGTEGLNRLFSFRLELVSTNAALDTGKLLSADAQFVILREGAPPAVFHGYPFRVEQGGRFGEYTAYTVELQPAFKKLAGLKHSAIFLRKTAQEAARELLQSQPFFHFEHEFRLTRQYPEQEFAMQYEESLYDYILFRMEEQGAYFYFDPDRDRVIFADGPVSHGQAVTTLAYAPASGLDHTRREEILHAFTLSRTALPKQVILRCYDWKDPKRVIVGRALVDAEGVGDVYLAGENAESEDEANRLAQIRAEELFCKGRVFTGMSSVPLLRPGLLFKVDGHYNPAFDSEYLVTEITHEGAQEAYISLGLGVPIKDDPDHHFYRNSFSCIPAEVPYRPAWTAPRAKISGVLHAFVDGASNRRAEMDEYGRYKLIFPFDVSGRKRGNASCWIRMAGPQTGKDSGMAFPLLPGAEVVVSFIDGNPDRPVITGSLANGETGSIVGRANANFSGFRTPGGNRLVFNDTDKNQGYAFVTASGLGESTSDPSSGGPGLSSTVQDLALETASVGAAEFATAFKTTAGGFKMSQSVSKDAQAVAMTLLEPLLESLAKTGDALAEKANDMTKDAFGGSEHAQAWTEAVGGFGADLVRAALPPALQILDSGITAARSGKDAPAYGVDLRAGATSASSSLLIKPNLALLLGSVVSSLLARATAGFTPMAVGVHGLEQEGERSDHYVQAVRQYITAPLAAMVPEIVSLLLLVVSGVNTIGKKLGGVSISSGDNNVNIRAAEPVSVHSQTGILLETTQSMADAGKWGVKPLQDHQTLDGLWQGPPADTPTQKYVVVNTPTLGLFAEKIRANATTDLVAVAPTLTLQSDKDNPNARLEMKQAGGGSIEATVTENGKIVLSRGDTKPKLELSDQGCLLVNGQNVRLTLTDKKATLKSGDDGILLDVPSGKTLTIKVGNAEYEFQDGKFISPKPAHVQGVKVNKDGLANDGGAKVQLVGNMVKI